MFSQLSFFSTVFLICFLVFCHFSILSFALDLPQFGPILERCFTSTSAAHSSPTHQYVGLNETELECCLLKDIAQCHHRDCFTAASTGGSISSSASPTPPLHMECNSTSLQLTRSLITAACSKTDIPEADVGDYCSRRWIPVKGGSYQAEQYRCKVTIWALVSLLLLQAVIFIFWAQLTDVGRIIKNRARNYVFFL